MKQKITFNHLLSILYKNTWLKYCVVLSKNKSKYVGLTNILDVYPTFLKYLWGFKLIIQLPLNAIYSGLASTEYIAY